MMLREPQNFNLVLKTFEILLRNNDHIFINTLAIVTQRKSTHILILALFQIMYPLYITLHS